MAGKHHIRSLAKILTRLQEERLQGAVILWADWSNTVDQSTNVPSLEVLVDRHGIMTARCLDGTEDIVITMLLGREACIKKPNFSLSLNGPADPVLTAGEPINVTAEAIAEFVTAVGDNNKIHQNDRPIIPGLLLMEYLLDRRPEDANALSMRFKHPAVAGNIRIDGSKNKIIQNGRCTTTYRWIEDRCGLHSTEKGGRIV